MSLSSMSTKATSACIGMNIFCFRDKVDELGLKAVLQKIKIAGCTCVEPMIIPAEDEHVPEWLWTIKSMKENVAFCKEIGLEIKSCHLAFGFKEEDRISPQVTADFINHYSEFQAQSFSL